MRRVCLTADGLWRRICQARKSGKESAEFEHKLAALLPPGLYEHFKSTEESQKLYVVHGIVLEVNTHAGPEVAYTALYAPHAGELVGRQLLHPKDGFIVPIKRPNDPVYPWVGKRFRLIRKLRHEQIGRLMDHAKYIARRKKRREEALATITRLLGY